MKNWECKSPSCRRNSGKKSLRCCPRKKALADRGWIIVVYWKAFCGCSRPARAGAICPRNIPARPRAGAVWHAGKNKASGSMCGGLFFLNWMPVAPWIGKKVFWTPVSLQPKRGRVRRQNQARQGHKVDGGGRRLGCSSGKPTGFGQPGGSDADRKHAAEHLCAATTRPAAQSPLAGHCRSGLRQRPLALALAPTRHSADCPAPQEPEKTLAQRRSGTAALSQTLEDRAHLCLAGKFPTPARAPRPSRAYV